MDADGDRTSNAGYLDFDLEVGQGSGRRYPVLARSPVGEAREDMRFPFTQAALENRLLSLELALYSSGGTRRRINAPEEQTVQDFGRALFDALFVGDVRGLYGESVREAARQGKGLRVRLHVTPPQLAMLPWEFLYDSRQAEYVCLSTHTPLVRYPDVPQPMERLAVTPPLRILGMVVNARDLEPLDIEYEKQRVEDAVSDLRARGMIELTWLEGQTWRDLQRAMRRGPWHVFHFIGHGGYDTATDEGLIALASETGDKHLLPATSLARLIDDHHFLRLVILNSCEGAKGGDRDAFSGTAATLVRRGIPAVLAMQYEITDIAAIEFARSFYEAVADGLPVDAAVAEARTALSIAIGGTLEWGTPVLYMRSPDGRIFHVQSATSVKPTDQRHSADPEQLPRSGHPGAGALAPGDTLAPAGVQTTGLEPTSAIQSSSPEPLQKADITTGAPPAQADLSGTASKTQPNHGAPPDSAQGPSSSADESTEESRVEQVQPSSGIMARLPGLLRIAAAVPVWWGRWRTSVIRSLLVTALSGGGLWAAGQTWQEVRQPTPLSPSPQAAAAGTQGATAPSPTAQARSVAGAGRPAISSDGTMFRGNLAHTGLYPTTPTVTVGDLLWKRRIGGGIERPPAVSEGTLYFGGREGTFYAIEAATGRPRWSFSTPTQEQIRSAAALAGDVVYFGSDDWNLYALDARTGTLLWKYGTDGPVYSAPAVADGVVYVGSHDQHVYSLDAATGELRWKTHTSGPVRSSPAVVEGTVYIGSDDGNMYALDAENGDTVWTLLTGGPIGSSPAVSNGLVYFGSADGTFYAADTQTGQEQWRHKTGARVESSPAVFEGVVYFGSLDHHLYARYAGTGREKWIFRTRGGVGSSPSIASGVVYFGSMDQNLYAVDARTGEEIWRYRTAGNAAASPALGDGVVFLGGLDGNLYALR